MIVITLPISACFLTKIENQIISVSGHIVPFFLREARKERFGHALYILVSGLLALRRPKNVVFTCVRCLEKQLL